MDFSKRVSTAEERQTALDIAKAVFAARGYEGDVFVKEAEAEKEGYTCETCTCGMVMPAQLHFSVCPTKECPFNGGRSMLDMLLPDEEQSCAS